MATAALRAVAAQGRPKAFARTPILAPSLRTWQPVENAEIHCAAGQRAAPRKHWGLSDGRGCALIAERATTQLPHSVMPSCSTARRHPSVDQRHRRRRAGLPRAIIHWRMRPGRRLRLKVSQHSTGRSGSRLRSCSRNSASGPSAEAAFSSGRQGGREETWQPPVGGRL